MDIKEIQKELEPRLKEEFPEWPCEFYPSYVQLFPLPDCKCLHYELLKGGSLFLHVKETRIGEHCDDFKSGFRAELDKCMDEYNKNKDKKCQIKTGVFA